MSDIIKIHAIQKYFPITGVQANQSVCMELSPGEIIGITGENGAGKSTLVTILAGEIPADSGYISINGTHLPNGIPHPEVGLVHQHPVLIPDRPVWESIAIGHKTSRIFCRKKIRQQVAQKLAEMDIDLPLDAPGRELSIGQVHLAELATVLLKKPLLLILDEPTAACTPHEREIIFDRIRALEDTAIIYISHRHHEMRQLCNRVFRLENGTLQQVQLEKIESEKSTFRNTIGTIHKQLPPVVSIQNLNAESPGFGQLRNISFSIRPGEILGISGFRDHGLLLLEDVIAGRRKYQGDIKIGDASINNPASARQAGMRYIPTQRFTRGLALHLPVVESLREHILLRHSSCQQTGIWKEKRVQSFSAQLLHRADLPQDSNQALSSFSGGMRQRILIARETDVEKADLSFCLICEPAIGLDKDGRDQLWHSVRELAARGAAILLLSSTIAEIQPFCTRMHLLYEGQLLKNQTFSPPKTGAPA